MSIRLFIYALSISLSQQVNGAEQRSITDSSVAWPTLKELFRVIMLRDYNTRVVVIGAMLLGLAAGTIGTFLLMRKRSLMGDAISHATLPGIALAFVVMTALGQDGKWLPGLLLGALISGLIGMGLILVIRNCTRLKEDVALGVVLSVFFGFGVSILGMIQKMSTGHAAGLESFIYGKTASMLAQDAKLIACIAAVVVVACVLLYKEFSLICFDQEYAASQGWPVIMLDLIMMILVVTVTVIGLQAVGLILIIALLIIPPAAARFWSDRLFKIVIIAGAIGALSGFVGAGLSALIPRLPAGAIIVLVAAVIFLLSMTFGVSRGVLPRVIQQRRLTRKVGRQHVLRALYEWHEKGESAGSTPPRPSAITFNELLNMRSWSRRSLRRLLARIKREELITELSPSTFKFTEKGGIIAKHIVRNHRLWEMYLITHADIAPSRVDRDADQIEHVLGQVLVTKLEANMVSEYPHLAMPVSPHPL